MILGCNITKLFRRCTVKLFFLNSLTWIFDFPTLQSLVTQTQTSLQCSHDTCAHFKMVQSNTHLPHCFFFIYFFKQQIQKVNNYLLQRLCNNMVLNAGGSVSIPKSCIHACGHVTPSSRPLLYYFFFFLINRRQNCECQNSPAD